jgi:hypothetical protein
MLEANGPNLSAFRLHQRKLLMYRSWGMVLSEDVICYYESVQNVIGGPKILGRFRLFMVPGMGQAPRAQSRARLVS